jgi:hypothetical protein
MYAAGSPMLLDDQRLNAFINRENKMRNKQTELEKAVSDLVLTHPGSPPRAPVLEDALITRVTPSYSSKAIRATAGHPFPAIFSAS